MHYVTGIDIGTGFTKAVLIGEEGEGAGPRILGKAQVRTGVRLEEAAAAALEAARQQAGLAAREACYVSTTGFGRYSAGFRDIQVTEITSGARGAYFLDPQSPCVLDIGCQSSRAIALVGKGRVRAFKTNDKCAAGSGSFIARAAKYLDVPLERVGELALQGQSPQPISSICAVLAESEIINHVSAGIAVEDILRGIYDSLASRAALLLRRTGMGDRVTFIGGVARQQGMVQALVERLGVTVHVPESSEYVCALGAALLGLQRLRKNLRAGASAAPARVG
jgi:(R)-2-hydroxyacyl-CoA dehydratese activating ATPase